MKKLLILLMLVGLMQLNAQTNVSGGIYSNTTWTKANSPYIITDTVVVFPGVILTIQPGVEVKFDNNQRLEIRQAQLIAIGTNNDSITFTSNSISPTAGIYIGIYLNGGNYSRFNYCNFRYGYIGIEDNLAIADTLFVKNSNFFNNNFGIFGDATCCGIIDSCVFIKNTINGMAEITNGQIRNCTFNSNGVGIAGGIVSANTYSEIKNCLFYLNQTGLQSVLATHLYNCIIRKNQYGITPFGTTTTSNVIKNSIIDSNIISGVQLCGKDSIVNCIIKNNGIGIIDNRNNHPPCFISENRIENNNNGVVFYHQEQFLCNSLCNNATFAVVDSSSNSLNIPNNFWCTTDSSATEIKIYDGYDNINYGLVTFMPIDTQCYKGLTANIKHINSIQNYLLIYPNPSNGNFQITCADNIDEIIVIDILGQTVYEEKRNGTTSILQLTNTGTYFISVTSGTETNVKRVVVNK